MKFNKSLYSAQFYDSPEFRKVLNEYCKLHSISDEDKWSTRNQLCMIWNSALDTVGLNKDNRHLICLKAIIASFVVQNINEFIGFTKSNPMGETPESWEKILREMKDGFELVVNDDYDIPKNQVKVKHSIQLFNKWFLDLWS